MLTFLRDHLPFGEIPIKLYLQARARDDERDELSRDNVRPTSKGDRAGLADQESIPFDEESEDFEDDGEFEEDEFDDDGVEDEDDGLEDEDNDLSDDEDAAASEELNSKLPPSAD